MKKKKYDKWRPKNVKDWFFLCVGLALILFIIVISAEFVQNNLVVNNYKITISECSNNTYVNFNCNSGSEGKIISKYWDAIKNVINEPCVGVYEYSYQHCNKIEVDEIIINNTKKNCVSWKDRNNVSDYDYLHYGIPCIKLEYIENITYIKKSDLTKEWLDKNCECIGCKKNTACCDGDCNKANCAKYKCGEYTITKE